MINRLTIVAIAAFAVTGCSTAPSMLSKQASVQERTEAALKALPGKSLPVTDDTVGTAASGDALAARIRPVAKRATKAWIGARISDVQDDAVLPPIFSENVKLNFDDRATRGRVSLAVVAERLSRISGVPVRIKADVYQAHPQQNATAGAATPVSTGAPLPSSVPLPTGVPAAVTTAVKQVAQEEGSSGSSYYQQPETSVESVEMKWDKSLSGFLDHLTGRLNLSWAYRDNTVVLERYMTESFEIPSFGGRQNYKMALTGSNSSGGTSSSSGGTSGSATSTLDLDESGNMSVMESLKQSIEATVRASGGSVVLNEGTGRFYVTTTRDVMGRVRDLFKMEVTSLQRQAHIQFDIYSVVKNDDDQSGVDWTVIFKHLSGTWGAAMSSPTTLTGTSAGKLGVSILSSGTSSASAQFGNSAAMLNLLHEVGLTANYRPVSLIALNRQWARKTNLKVNGYVSETTSASSSSSGTSTPGLKTSSVTTGDKFMVQPAIMDNGAIMLKFGVSLTELLSLYEVTAGSGDTLQRVQTPETSGTDDQGTINLLPGQAMVVTGLSRRIAKSDRRSLTENSPLAFGGSHADSFKREDFLIVVRASQI